MFLSARCLDTKPPLESVPSGLRAGCSPGRAQRASILGCCKVILPLPSDTHTAIHTDIPLPRALPPEILRRKPACPSIQAPCFLWHKEVFSSAGPLNRRQQQVPKCSDTDSPNPDEAGKAFGITMWLAESSPRASWGMSSPTCPSNLQ